MTKLSPAASNPNYADLDAIALFEKVVLEETFSEERIDYRIATSLADPGNRLWPRRKEAWKEAVINRLRIETSFSQTPDNSPATTAGLSLEGIKNGICSPFTTEFRKPYLFDTSEILINAIQHGFALTVLFLLRDGAVLSSVDLLGRTPIHHAVTQGSPTVLRILQLEGLRRSPQALDARDSQKQTALDIAIAKNDGATARILLSYGAQDIKSRLGAKKMMRLSLLLVPELLKIRSELTVLAIKRRKTELELQSQDEYRMNLLHWVLWKGDSLCEFKEILQNLYKEEPAKVVYFLRQEDFVDRTPIECAVLAMRPRILQYLLESPFSIPAFGNLEAWYKVTYYTALPERQYIELTRQLLFEYSNEFDKDMRLAVTTAIIAAALVRGSDRIITMFCDVLKDESYFERHTFSADLKSDLLRLFDVETEPVCNSSARSVNISDDDDCQSSPDGSNRDKFKSASGQTAAVPDLGRFEKDLSQKSPLAFAAKMGRNEMVYSLLSLGCRVDRQLEDFGRTALMLAVMEGNRPIASQLIDAGANVDACDHDRRMALSYAAEQGDVQLLELLLERQDESLIALKDTWGRTPLIYAAMYGHSDFFERLFKLDRNRRDTINIRDNAGRTAFSYAAENGNLAILQRLKRLDTSDANATQISDNAGRTPLSYAAEKGHLEVVELLLSISPAYCASDLRSPEGAPKPKFKSPLAYAAETGHHDVVRRLIEHNADVDTTDESGKTPLHLAAEKLQWGVMSVLLNHGETNVLATDATNKTPCQVLEEAMFERQQLIDDERILASISGAYEEVRQRFISLEKFARAPRWQTFQQRPFYTTDVLQIQQYAPLQTQQTNPSASGVNLNGASNPPPEPPYPPPPPPISRQSTHYHLPPQDGYPPSLLPSFPPPLLYQTPPHDGYPPSL